LTLLDDLFIQLNYFDIDTGFVTTLKLDPGHKVYTGHFPGYPVTPGVVQMQIVHELLEIHLGKQLRLIEMLQCKFLKILTPNETPQITLKVNYTFMDKLLKTKASITDGHQTIFSAIPTYEIVRDKITTNDIPSE
jgi:3-hydroxyacyl-[acyl-carrier-protein] dehydratase